MKWTLTYTPLIYQKLCKLDEGIMLIFVSQKSAITFGEGCRRSLDTFYYRKVSNIRRTKYQNLNDSRLILQLSVPNPLKPSVKSIMKM